MMEEVASLSLRAADFTEPEQVGCMDVVYMPRADHERGAHGGRMHAELLRQPVPPDTTRLLVRLTHYTRQVPQADVVFRREAQEE